MPNKNDPKLYNKYGNPESDKKILNILEKYLRTGKTPTWYPNFYTEDTEKSEFDYHELEIKNEDFTVSHSVPKIQFIRRDLTLEKLKEFEKLAEIYKWDDKQMGIIYFATICDTSYTNKLDHTSYINLKRQLIEIISPRYYNHEDYKD